MLVTLYSKPECHLCEDVLAILHRLAPRYGFTLHEVNILDDPALLEAYGEKVPVVVAGKGDMGWLVAPIEEKELESYLRMVKATSEQPAPRREIPREFWLDRAVGYVGRHWLGFVNGALAIFVGLPWLAALFAAFGLWALADPIYTAYSLQCHQLPERAPTFLGFEVAQCIRCSALYGGILLFGIAYGRARDRNSSWFRWLLKPIPWYIFLLLLLPILADGITHIAGIRTSLGGEIEPGFGTFEFGAQAFSLNWWLRIITGLIAGLGSVWWAYPRINRSMEQSEELRLAYRRELVKRYAAG